MARNNNEFPLVKFKEWKCKVHRARYGNGRVALTLDEIGTYDPIAVVTVNLPDVPLEEGEIIIKNWSENEGILKAMFNAGWISESKRQVKTGFVKADIVDLLL